MKKFLPLIYLFTFALSIFTPTQSAFAEPDRYTSVNIITEKSNVKAGETIEIATEIRLYPKWHVYWRNPGDSGLPVSIQWDGPEGFKFSDIKWPTPDKISYEILANYGYYTTVSLLQDLEIPKDYDGSPVTFNATVDMLVCNDICIPESSEISIDLNPYDEQETKNEDYFESAHTPLPIPLKGTYSFQETNTSVKNLTVTLTPSDQDKLVLFQGANLDFFPYAMGVINHVKDPVVVVKDSTIVIVHERGDQPLPDTLQGLLVIKGEEGKNIGFEIEATLDASASISPAEIGTSKDVQTSSPPLTFLSAIILAIMGGLVLNLMPCVFPVLSIKALSLVKMGEKEHKAARTHGLSYTAGVIISFLIIGGVLLILKEAGAVIGWGFQLQNPVIVAILAYLLFTIGLNLMGFFEVGGRLTNVGQNLTNSQSYSGSFFTGALATIVATPCTAPFMGAAMGFALTQPTIVSLSVFAALGFGLALPYLLLSYIPALRAFLPKPGAWMNTFKQFLAFPMFGFSLWLVWVLSQQSDTYGVLLTLLGMLALCFMVWLSQLKSKGFTKLLTRTLFIFSVGFIIFTLLFIKPTNTFEKQNYEFGSIFSEETLAIALETDQPVFVEMTAAWCITCKFNHATSLNIDSTKTLFAQKNVNYLIGDWTNYDEEITQYLHKYGRNGVPIYVYYAAPNADGARPEPVLLPQLLTPTIIQNTIG